MAPAARGQQAATGRKGPQAWAKRPKVRKCKSVKSKKGQGKRQKARGKRYI